MDGMYRKGKLGADQAKRDEWIGKTPSPSPSQLGQSGLYIKQAVDLDNVSYVSNRYIILLIALLAAAVWYILTGGHVLDVVLLSLVVITYIWIAHRMMAVALESGPVSLLHLKGKDVDSMGIDYKALIVGYMEVVKRRMLLCTLFYMIFFPVLMLLVSRSIWGGYAHLSMDVLSWILAFGIGITGWYLYDTRIIQSYEDMTDKVRSLEILSREK